MRSILSTIMALFTSVFLLLLGNSLLSTLLVLRGVHEGFSEKYLGLLTSVYFLGAFVATLTASKMIKRMGHIRCFTFCSALLACSTLAYLLIISPTTWLIVRFLTGFGVFVMYTVVESWLNGQTEDEYRGRVFSIYTLVNLVAIAASQQLLFIDSVTGYILFIIAAFFVSAAIMPVSSTRLQQPHISVDLPTLSLKKLYKAAPVALTGCLVSGLIMGPFWGLTPLFVSGLGYSENELAVFLSISIFGGALIQYPLGRLSDFMDRRKVLLVAFIMGLISSIVLTFFAWYFPQQKLVLIALSTLFCGLVLAIYPISVVHLVERIHKDNLVSGSSRLLMVYGVGSFIGPAIAGIVLQFYGLDSLALYYAIIFALFSVVLGLQIMRSSVIEHPEDHETHYVTMVRTSQNVLPLHPESEEFIEAPEERRAGSR